MIRFLVTGLFVLVAWATMAGLVFGWLQWVHPAFDSFSHFRLSLCALALPIVLFLLLLGRRRLALVLALSMMISAVLTTPYLPGLGPGAVASAGTDERFIDVAQFNLRFNNRETERAISVLQGASADIIILQEVTATTAPVVDAFAQSHPHRVACYTPGNGSVAILSVFPLVPGEPGDCRRRLGWASGKFRVADLDLTIASFHARWPWPAGQARHIDRLTPAMAALRSPAILAGDFNAAPWSAAVQRVAGHAGLDIVSGVAWSWAPRFTTPARFARHFGQTWQQAARWDFPQQVKHLMGLFGPVLPIDQILHSPTLTPVKRRVLDDAGSDHYPVLTRFRLS